jgi:hypothetical protein
MGKFVFFYTVDRGELQRRYPDSIIHGVTSLSLRFSSLCYRFDFDVE